MYCSVLYFSQVRVTAVPNGETNQKAVVVFGASIEEVFNSRFYLCWPPKKFPR